VYFGQLTGPGVCARLKLGPRGPRDWVGGETLGVRGGGG